MCEGSNWVLRGAARFWLGDVTWRLRQRFSSFILARSKFYDLALAGYG